MIILLIKINSEPILIDFLKEDGKNKIFESFEEVDSWLFDNNSHENEYQPVIIEKPKDLKNLLQDFIKNS